MQASPQRPLHTLVYRCHHDAGRAMDPCAATLLTLTEHPALPHADADLAQFPKLAASFYK